MSKPLLEPNINKNLRKEKFVSKNQKRPAYSNFVKFLPKKMGRQKSAAHRSLPSGPPLNFVFFFFGG
jgi:hypothetical protein